LTVRAGHCCAKHTGVEPNSTQQALASASHRPKTISSSFGLQRRRNRVVVLQF
jgi:hypothetical protein